jgi:replicative DNA helicase
LTLFLAPSNVGKTTVCSILGAEIMDDFHLGMIYLEEDKRETFLRQIASKLKVNYLKFKENPLSVASREEIQAVYDDIAQNNKLAIVDHFGSMPVDGLMNKIKHLHLVEGCRFIILDHISMVVSGTETDNERKELDIVMTALASFCAANPVHVLVISHINRTNAQQFLPPKGSEGEPFWVNVTKESARGSSALEACSWNIVALEPEVMPDFSRGRVRFKILKTRFGNFLGIADVFTLDKETWQPILEEDTMQNF